jgi:amino acid permease
MMGLSLLAKCAQRVHSRDAGFSTVAALTHPSAVLLFDLAIAMKCFGVAISYLIVIGDLVRRIKKLNGQMPKISLSISPHLCATSILLKKQFWIPIAIFMIAPLCYLRRLSSLKHVSILALFGVIYLISLVVGLYTYPLEEMPQSLRWHEIVWFKWDIECLKNLPIFIFAFTCHQNVRGAFHLTQDRFLPFIMN